MVTDDLGDTRDLAIRTGNGSPATASTDFAFWCAGPTDAR